MAKAKLAAVGPVFNCPSEVIQALDSVAAQTRVSDRAIIVDDGSTDRTTERVAPWLRQRKLSCPAELICQANHGTGAARTRGAAGDCEPFAFLDSDDLWPPDYLQRLAAVVEPLFDLRRADIGAAALRTVRQAGDQSGHQDMVTTAEELAAGFTCGKSPRPATVAGDAKPV